MSKKKSTSGGPSPRPDNHKERYMAPVRRQFIPGLEQLAQHRACPLSDIVNEAVRLYLEREGLWPPPGREK